MHDFYFVPVFMFDIAKQLAAPERADGDNEIGVANLFRQRNEFRLVEFFGEKLPNPDKQFTVMSGISHASFQQKNYMMVYHILAGWFTQPEPVYKG